MSGAEGVDRCESSPGLDYLARCEELIDRVRAQRAEIERAADLFARSILAGRLVHVFGSGHSRILAEELWPRYGSFPGFHPIVELSLTFHNQVVGANGQRQAMFLENVSGLADRILRNFDIRTEDSALVLSSSGTTLVAVEFAERLRAQGLPIVVIISRDHSDRSASRRDDGRKLQDFADVSLDTGAPPGDAMVRVPGLDTPVAPGSTIGGCLLVNALKAEVAARLTEAGQPPPVLSAPSVVGPQRASDLFERAYDEHARRVARLFAEIGGDASASAPVRSPEETGADS